MKLGVIPATISPYVVAKIGPAAARPLFMTGESITAKKAKEVGVVQEVVDTPEQLELEAEKILRTINHAAPGAMKAAKALVRNVQFQPVTEELQKYTAAELSKAQRARRRRTRPSCALSRHECT